MPDSFTTHLRDWLGFVGATVGSRLFTAAALPTVRTLISPTLGHLEAP